ncbi:MAG: queuosine precursor transporter, partial [Acidihalobacter sp.]
FHYWKEKTGGRYLWLRNNASTMVSQALDSIIFVGIAFWGVFPWPEFFQILLTTYIMKFIIAAADTPFIYLAKHLTPRGAAQPEA